ncbi:MAG: hypothetical protein HQL86_03810 [Magnetococcales bacterium]|nr:hypothetical protein [Magnetococcales bacterium]
MMRGGWRGFARLRIVAGVLLLLGMAGCAATPESVPPLTQETGGPVVLAAQPAAPVVELAKAPLADMVMVPEEDQGVGCPCGKKACTPADKKAGSCGKKCASCAKMKHCKNALKSGSKACKGGDTCHGKKKCHHKEKCHSKAKCDHGVMKEGCCPKCGKESQTGKKCELPATM